MSGAGSIKTAGAAIRRKLSLLLGLNGIVGGIGFATTILVANRLSELDFGFYSLGIALGAYGSTVSTWGTDRTLVRDLIGRPERFTELVMGSLLLRGALGLTFVCMLWALPFPNSLTPVTIVIVAAIVIRSLEMGAFFESEGNPEVYSLFVLCERAILLTGLILIFGVAPLPTGLTSVAILVMITSAGGVTIQSRYLTKRRSGVELKKVCKIVVRLFFDNIPYALAALIALSFGALSKIILESSEGPRALAQYAACWQIVVLSSLAIGQTARVLRPSLITAVNSRNRSGIYLCVRKYLLVNFVISAAIAAPAIVAPTMILDLLYPSNYTAAAAVLQILGVYTVLLSVGVIASHYLMAARLDSFYLKAAASGAAATLLLYFLWVPDHGATGAALAVTIGHSLTMLAYIAIATRHWAGIPPH